MHLDYSDILAKAGPPTYWGPFGVPRYEEFDATRLNVFTSHAAKLHVLCQSCGREFVVVSTYDKSSEVLELPELQEAKDPWHALGSFHYGYPPVHHCAGDSIASLPLEILEFWKRKGLTDWARVPEYEFALHTLEMRCAYGLERHHEQEPPQRYDLA
jgi:hypothetical protein